MERIYEFEKTAYRNKIMLINVLLVPIFLYCLYRIVFVPKNTILFALVGVVSFYGIFNSLVRKANPRIIRVSDDEISFESFGVKRYVIADLVKFRVRIVTPNYQVTVRLAGKDGKHAMFWIIYPLFNDPADLLAELDYLERKIHPESLRFRGRGKMGASRPGVKTETEAPAVEPRI